MVDGVRWRETRSVCATPALLQSAWILVDGPRVCVSLCAASSDAWAGSRRSFRPRGMGRLAEVTGTGMSPVLGGWRRAGEGGERNKRRLESQLHGNGQWYVSWQARVGGRSPLGFEPLYLKIISKSVPWERERYLSRLSGLEATCLARSVQLVSKCRSCLDSASRTPKMYHL